MARPHDDIVARLERYREEQRAMRAARRAERQLVDSGAPGGPPATPGDGGPAAAVPPDPAAVRGSSVLRESGESAAGGARKFTAADLFLSRQDPENDPAGERKPEPEPERSAVRMPADEDVKLRAGDDLFLSRHPDLPEHDAPLTSVPIPDGAPDVGSRAAAPTHREVVVDRIRAGVRGLGQALITTGVVILLFVVYELWITDIFNEQKQGQLASQLSDTWGNGEDPLAPTVVGEPGTKIRNIPIGQGIALIRIPALGLDYVRVIVEGTGEASLNEGPGHYVDTVLPGQIGNFSVAGHRVGKGSPFLDLDRLKAGDPIVIETKTAYYVYRVLGDRRTGNPAVPGRSGIPGREIVDPSDTDVIGPVPDHPGLAPDGGRFLTLTTCHPRFSARQRMVIHAALDGPAWPKSRGLPPVLKG